MKRLLFIGKIILGPVFILSLLSGYWTLAYYAASWGFRHWNWEPHMLLRQLIVSILGFIFLGLSISIVSPHMRRHQREFFQELTIALKRISKGDFRVSLDVQKGRNDFPLSELVDSINDMAVNLQAMEEMRQEFISNVSHEIQSPLTSISGFARAMIYEELPRDEQLQYLEIIDAESVRLSKLSDDLLRLASLNSEHHPFHPESFRLDKQLQRQILAFEPQWLNKQLEFNADLEEMTVQADPILLSQVWVNLIQNAIKFTPEGGTITVSLEYSQEHAVIRIADNGIGMSEEDRGRIFERFFKADRSRTRSAGGNGLGLSIVHKIVEIHGGSIDVCSMLGEGTAFIVNIPVIHHSPDGT